MALREGARHPVARFARRLGARLPARARARLLRLHVRGDEAVRRHIAAWNALPKGTTPEQRVRELVARFEAEADDTLRDLVVLRTVQSLTVLDVRNYRDLVFRLGRYAEDGEDPGLATALPDESGFAMAPDRAFGGRGRSGEG